MADWNSPEFPEQPPIVTLESERLQLRTLQMTDLEDIMPILTDKKIFASFGQDPPANRQQAVSWLKTHALGPDVFNFALREKTANGVGSEVVGILGSYNLPQAGYVMRTDRQGRGYATEALRTYLPAFFERFDPSSTRGGTSMDHVEGHVDVSNKSSQRVLEKCGFMRCELLADVSQIGEIIVYRLPRPGKTLIQLGLDPASDDKPPEPPVQ